MTEISDYNKKFSDDDIGDFDAEQFCELQNRFDWQGKYNIEGSLYLISSVQKQPLYWMKMISADDYESEMMRMNLSIP